MKVSDYFTKGVSLLFLLEITIACFTENTFYPTTITKRNNLNISKLDYCLREHEWKNTNSNKNRVLYNYDDFPARDKNPTKSQNPKLIVKIETYINHSTLLLFKFRDVTAKCHRLDEKSVCYIYIYIPHA